MLTDEQIIELLTPYINTEDGPHPHGYCSVAFGAISAEYHATVTAWVERDGLGHRTFQTSSPAAGSRPLERPDRPRHAEPFWIIPRARLAPT
jgi:hypothetical protein